MVCGRSRQVGIVRGGLVAPGYNNEALIRDAPCSAHPQDRLPVSLVHGTFVPDADVAIIADKICIFVNRDWKAQLSPFFGEDTTGTMDLDAADALAIILLHEFGHIQPAAVPDNSTVSVLAAT